MNQSLVKLRSHILISWFGGYLCLFCFNGCESYRVVKLGPGVAENNIVSPFYAVARNNVVIPEYVIDSYGNYPTNPEEAQKRFEKQKSSVEPIVREKYDLSSSSTGQVPQYILGIGLSLVSPFVLPVKWVGEVLSGKSGKTRSFSQIAADYFNVSFNSSLHGMPRIKERIDYFY